MLRLPPFRYLAPRGLTEASELMASQNEPAMFVAGGTDLYPKMKRRQFTPRVLISLREIAELKHIKGSAEVGLRIGAGATLSAVAAHPIIQAHYSALATAAESVSTPQLRNAGTIGGNLLLDTRCNYYDQTEFWRNSIGYCMKKDGDICLVAPGSPRCWAISSADTAPVLVSLDARLRLVSSQGERVIAALDLFRDDGMQPFTKSADEVLAEVLLPPAAGWHSSYLKLRRRGSFDFPILGVAAALRFNEDQTIAQARLVLGAVASHPVDAQDAAQLLIGHKLSHELLEAVATAATKRAKPLHNADLTINYRKQVTPIYIRRALEQITP
ncbi:4-hydroxybenzoyl-CoA reductase [Ktedonosporobacter rubrisoli]|uniref:4-hydroxybenzoyl-CoA reductase n=1 Tax=Ktedonosporobacter rubrisoli TaxID=2509675 RepID=A0A4P6JQY1_KTERU|nr:FAD binding domain-containing protein [Ktedonosporobacter rubrisoli]QBD77849.1 4-hydroxybenzoyl-CoA reductase [Ktedonosporobacter rubrisoli]